MILAIETSTPEASLALFDESAGEVVWQQAFTSDRAHNAAVFGPLEKALDEVGADSAAGLTTIVVGTGPGSYSGVRVGIAVANGVSLARGVPCFGLPSLIALPTVEGCADYRVVGDARRGEFFVIEIRGGTVRGEAELMSAEAMAERLAAADDDLMACTTEDSVAARFAGVSLLRPVAALLAKRAAAPGDTTRVEASLVAIEPWYLRAPHITVAKKKANLP